MRRGEIALGRRTVVEKQRERTDRTQGGADLLARLELGRTWPSYLTTTLVALFFGLFAGSFLREGAYGDGLTGFFLDWVFLFVLANLGINWTSTNWFYVHTDPFTPRLSFLRALPIPIRDLVLGRLILALATTVVTSSAFFLPSYALFPVLRAEIPPTQYLWFVLFWVGYVLFSTGILLFLEMGVRGVWALVACFAWATLLLAVVVLAQAGGLPLVTGSLWLMREYGPLIAVSALGVGGSALFLWCRLLEHRMRTRELAS